MPTYAVANHEHDDEKKNVARRTNRRKITAAGTEADDPADLVAQEEWGRDIFDLVPNLLTGTPGWVASGLTLEIEYFDYAVSRDALIKRYGPNDGEAIRIRLRNKHYSAVVNGRQVDVPEDGNRFFLAIWAALREDRHEGAVGHLFNGREPLTAQEGARRLRMAIVVCAGQEWEANRKRIPPTFGFREIRRVAPAPVSGADKPVKPALPNEPLWSFSSAEVGPGVIRFGNLVSAWIGHGPLVQTVLRGLVGTSPLPAQYSESKPAPFDPTPLVLAERLAMLPSWIASGLTLELDLNQRQVNGEPTIRRYGPEDAKFIRIRLEDGVWRAVVSRSGRRRAPGAGDGIRIREGDDYYSAIVNDEKVYVEARHDRFYHAVWDAIQANRYAAERLKLFNGNMPRNSHEAASRLRREVSLQAIQARRKGALVREVTRTLTHVGYQVAAQIHRRALFQCACRTLAGISPLLGNVASNVLSVRELLSMGVEEDWLGVAMIFLRNLPYHLLSREDCLFAIAEAVKGYIDNTIDYKNETIESWTGLDEGQMAAIYLLTGVIALGAEHIDSPMRYVAFPLSTLGKNIVGGIVLFGRAEQGYAVLERVVVAGERLTLSDLQMERMLLTAAEKKIQRDERRERRARIKTAAGRSELRAESKQSASPAPTPAPSPGSGVSASKPLIIAGALTAGTAYAASALGDAAAVGAPVVAEHTSLLVDSGAAAAAADVAVTTGGMRTLVRRSPLLAATVGVGGASSYGLYRLIRWLTGASAETPVSQGSERTINETSASAAAFVGLESAQLTRVLDQVREIRPGAVVADGEFSSPHLPAAIDAAANSFESLIETDGGLWNSSIDFDEMVDDFIISIGKKEVDFLVARSSVPPVGGDMFSERIDLVLSTCGGYANDSRSRYKRMSADSSNQQPARRITTNELIDWIRANWSSDEAFKPASDTSLERTLAGNYRSRTGETYPSLYENFIDNYNAWKINADGVLPWNFPGHDKGAPLQLTGTIRGQIQHGDIRPLVGKGVLFGKSNVDPGIDIYYVRSDSSVNTGKMPPKKIEMADINEENGMLHGLVAISPADLANSVAKNGPVMGRWNAQNSLGSNVRIIRVGNGPSGTVGVKIPLDQLPEGKPFLVSSGQLSGCTMVYAIDRDNFYAYHAGQKSGDSGWLTSREGAASIYNAHLQMTGRRVSGLEIKDNIIVDGKGEPVAGNDALVEIFSTYNKATINYLGKTVTHGQSTIPVKTRINVNIFNYDSLSTSKYPRVGVGYALLVKNKGQVKIVSYSEDSSLIKKGDETKVVIESRSENILKDFDEKIPAIKLEKIRETDNLPIDNDPEVNRRTSLLETVFYKDGELSAYVKNPSGNNRNAIERLWDLFVNGKNSKIILEFDDAATPGASASDVKELKNMILNDLYSVTIPPYTPARRRVE